MNPEQKYIANLAIDRWCKDSTARQIVRYVMECELWGQDTINPTNTYLAGKYGWTMNTIETAIKLAKKSQFITTTGSRKTRRFELNVGFLKGKMAEIVAQKPLKNTSFDDVLPPYLPPQLPPLVPPQLPPVEPPLTNSEYGVPTASKDQNEGDNNKSMNKNKNIGAVATAPRVIVQEPSFGGEGESVPALKKEKDANLDRSVKYWRELCKRETDLLPSTGIPTIKKILKNAHTHLTWPQIKQKMDEWFDVDGLQDHEKIQITRCFSTVQIDAFKAENV